MICAGVYGEAYTPTNNPGRVGHFFKRGKQTHSILVWMFHARLLFSPRQKKRTGRLHQGKKWRWPGQKGRSLMGGTKRKATLLAVNKVTGERGRSLDKKNESRQSEARKGFRPAFSNLAEGEGK